MSCNTASCWASATRSLNYWETKFEFRPTQVGIFGGPGHMLIGFTSTYDDPFSTSPPNQDAACVTWVSNPMSGNPSTFELKIQCKDGTGSWIYSSPIIMSTLNKTYYMTFSRTSSSSFTLDVYNDVCRTDYWGGISLNIGNASITDLTAIQHGCITVGSYRRVLTGTIDNTFITDGSCYKSEVASNNPNPDNIKTSDFSPIITPNPSDGKLQINFSKTDLASGVSVEIYNIIGMKIFEEGDISNQSMSVDLSQFDKGVYLVKFITNNKVYSDKIIIR